MPFTPSHAVIALPFVRTPLVPAALAIGAMTPDLPLFLRGIGVSYGFTHAPLNVVWTAVIALVLLTLWRAVLRPGLAALAPNVVAERLPAEWSRTGVDVVKDVIWQKGRPAYPALVALSLVLGVLSHIAWDAFTHEGRSGVSLIPALDANWGPLPGYKWLQHGSSVLGLVIIGVFALRWMLRRPATSRDRLLPTWVRWTWYLSLPVVLVSAWSLGAAAYGPLTSEFTIQHLAYRTLPLASGVWGALTVLLCGVIVLVSRRRPAR